jgi:hypothetical protein
MSTAAGFLDAHLARTLPSASQQWLQGAQRQVAAGMAPADFAGLIALASRYIPRRAALGLDAAARSQAFETLEGWNPERWTLLEAARVRLVLARADLEAPSSVEALETTFAYADIGELCALYKSLCLLPGPKRWVWRAGEGCRSSMRAVFEAVACDSPFPVQHFDDLAWRQMVIKALFVEAPLWRVYGLDRRLDTELARMALDLAEERRSAGRPIQPELWLVLGRHGGARGLALLQQELEQGPHAGRAAAALGLARAGELAPVLAAHAKETHSSVKGVMEQALKGSLAPAAFACLPS